MGLATLVGGMSTTIGTSTNLLVVSVAADMGMQPFQMFDFVLAVLFGANLSFITPMAYKTNLLVMNAGGYKFSDFVKVGTPLTILMWATLSVILSVAYDL
jgi:di/tricarboxylate transporter